MNFLQEIFSGNRRVLWRGLNLLIILSLIFQPIPAWALLGTQSPTHTGTSTQTTAFTASTGTTTTTTSTPTNTATATTTTFLSSNGGITSGTGTNTTTGGGTSTSITVLPTTAVPKTTFNGTSDYYEIRDQGSDPTRNAYTLSAWVKVEDLNNRNIIVRTSSAGPLSQFSNQIRIQDGKFQHYLYTSDGSRYVMTNDVTVEVGKWYFVVAEAQTNGPMKLYVNGQDQFKLFVNGQVQPTTYQVRQLWTGGDRYDVGIRSGRVSEGGVFGYFKGSLNNVKVEGRLLTQDEVKIRYYKELLQSQVGNGFVVNVTGQTGSPELEITIFDVNFSLPVPHMPGTFMGINAKVDASLKVLSIGAMFYGPRQGGKLLFDGIKELNSGLSDQEVLVKMTQVTVSGIDPNGTLHFSMNGNSYDLLRDPTTQAISITSLTVVSQLRNVFPGFIVSPAVYIQSSNPPRFQINVTNPSPATGTLQQMSFKVFADGAIDTTPIIAWMSWMIASYHAVTPNSELLFQGLKLIDVGASDADALGLMAQVSIRTADDAGVIHFSLRGKGYKVYHEGPQVIQERELLLPDGRWMNVRELTKQEMLEYVSSQSASGWDPDLGVIGEGRTAAFAAVQGVSEDGGFYRYTLMPASGTPFVQYECTNQKRNFDGSVNGLTSGLPEEMKLNQLGRIRIFDTAQAMIYDAMQFCFGGNAPLLRVMDSMNTTSTFPVESVKTFFLRLSDLAEVPVRLGIPTADIYYDLQGHVIHTTYLLPNWKPSLPRLSEPRGNAILRGFPLYTRKDYDSNGILLREISMRYWDARSMTVYGSVPMTQIPARVEIYTENQTHYASFEYNAQGELVSQTFLPASYGSLLPSVKTTISDPFYFGPRSTLPRFTVTTIVSSPMVGTLSQLIFNVGAMDGQIDFSTVQATYQGVNFQSFYNYGILEKIRNLQPTASDMQVLALMAQITINHIDGDSRLHFTLDGSPHIVNPPELLSKAQTYLMDDKVIDRDEMLALFEWVGSDGTVSEEEFIILKWVQNNPDLFPEIDYVHSLADAVVLGSSGNGTYAGVTLGNLDTGPDRLSVDKLIKLVNKWFRGMDRPTAFFNDVSGVYAKAVGSLYVGGLNYADIKQGAVGDCYFMAALAEVALQTPDVIRNMFMDNGDGTFTVKFFLNGVADYVTIDRYLLASGGTLIYANSGASVSDPYAELWTALAEKAYVQMNNKWGVPSNSYSIINGGYIRSALSALTGRVVDTSGDFFRNEFDSVVSTWSAGGLIGFASVMTPPLTKVLGAHAYALVGYSAATQMFSLFNPWGISYGLLTLTRDEIVRNFNHYDFTTGSGAGGGVSMDLGSFFQMTNQAVDSLTSNFMEGISVLPGIPIAINQIFHDKAIFRPSELGTATLEDKIVGSRTTTHQVVPGGTGKIEPQNPMRRLLGIRSETIAATPSKTVSEPGGFQNWFDQMRGKQGYKYSGNGMKGVKNPRLETRHVFSLRNYFSKRGSGKKNHFYREPLTARSVFLDLLFKNYLLSADSKL